jgi:hypothetical protein
MEDIITGYIVLSNLLLTIFLQLIFAIIAPNTTVADSPIQWKVGAFVVLPAIQLFFILFSIRYFKSKEKILEESKI